MSGSNGASNGTRAPVLVVTASELETRAARYRTALVALLALVKRNGNEYRSWNDQMLLVEIERLLDEDATRPVEQDLDA